MLKKFGNHWGKIKFYKDEPQLNKYEKLESIRFCEAISKAKIRPTLLDKESISCYGAQYAFGWQSRYQYENLDCEENKIKYQKFVPPVKVSETPRLNRPFNYIGLNLEGASDLIIS